MFDFDTTEWILFGVGLLIAYFGLEYSIHVRRTNALLEQINTKLFRLEKHFDTRDD